ncbi:Alpha/Beta hydrolase protein [Mycena vulgaris]|nr:Alpha/Beta hydrolase protein [Mycena vulgaris]KAJ6580167.1 Alpha/Beta hydrolase protein [Mycena vulgaris]
MFDQLHNPLSRMGLPLSLSLLGMNQTIRWVDCHENVPQPIESALNVTGTSFNGSLPSTLFCGEMDVPMDYTKPFDAATNNITIGFAMNRPSSSSGLIMYHAGGPGLDAASQAWANALNLSSGQPFAGLEDFDFLAVNTRGLQFSNPLNCSSGVFFNNVSFAFPTSQDEYDQYQAAMTNFYAACTNDTTPAGIMAHIGTVEVIQDWDSVRAALGYEKVSFAGVSYGTFVGMAYAGRFPDRVDRFVLDAAIPHGMPFQDMITDQVAAANRLLLRADAFCLTDPTCPFHGQGNGSVVKAWDTLLAQAIAAPLPALSCGPGTRCNSPVTPTDLRLGVSVLFRSNPDFPKFNIALNASLHGDASLFAYEPSDDIRETVVSPLLCSDFKLDESDKTFAGFNNFSVNSQSSDPAGIVYSQIWQFALMCAAWSFPVPERTTLPSDLPLMWITSDFDLNLPTELTTFAWEQAPNSTLVIRHGDDHTSILTGPPAAAAQSIAQDFLRTGAMPLASSDAEVTVISPGGTRGPVPGAYDVPTGAIAGDTSSVEAIE